MRITMRGWVVIGMSAFLFGAFFPWESMPWYGVSL